MTPGSGTFEVWNHKVLKKERVRPDAQLQASNGAVAQAVAGNKYAIGYVGIGYVNDKLKGLTVGGRQGQRQDRHGQFLPPWPAPCTCSPRVSPPAVVKDFIDFVKGDEGQKIAVEEGFVSFK